MLGRYPSDNTDEPPKFCAVLYTMGKGGIEDLKYGPKTGSTRKEALMRLLSNVEGNIGEMMMRDKWRREKEHREREGEKGGRGRERGGGN